MQTTSGARTHLWIWFVWLGLFYTVWLCLVSFGHSWGAVLEHWPIASAMAGGSYVAGSTPMGGGTVGFPVLVLFFDLPASLGRDFSFVVQSVGMTSAAIFIMARRQVVAWGIVRWAFVTALVVTPLSLNFLAPNLSPQFVTLMFAVMWCSFGIMHFTNLTDILQSSRIITESETDAFLGIMIGLFGGISASLTGVGIDMLLYIVMVSVMRVDIRVAIPTSVIMMAATSLIGTASTIVFGEMPVEAYENWLAAAPVVALGAPLGAFIVQFISRSKTLLFVSGLCVVQFVWTLIDQSITGLPLLLALVGVVVLNLLFRLLYKAGDKYAVAPISIALPEGPESRDYAAGVLDGVSGAYVSAYFYDRGNHEYTASSRHKRPLSVLTIRLTSATGLHGSYDSTRYEAALREIVERLVAISRAEDVCARLDDETFAILMPDTSAEGAHTYAGRVTSALSKEMTIANTDIEPILAVATLDSSHSSFAELVEAALTPHLKKAV